MSQFPTDPSQNPYAAYASPPAAAAAWGPGSSKRPKFCTVMFIMDLIFCLIRVPLVIFGFVAVSMLGTGKVQFPFPEELVWWEVGTGVGIVSFGLLANILLLMNKSSGVIFGWLAVMAAAASTIVGAAQQFGYSGPARMPGEDVGRMVGAVFGAIVRLGLNGMFVLAMLKFNAWQANRRTGEY